MSVNRIGNGPETCFAIPGWGEDSSSFAPLLDSLEARASLYAVDPPGYGNSPSPADFSMAEVTSRLLEEFRAANEQAGGEIRTLLGNCSGALFACEMALRMDPAPERLLLVDPFAFLPGYFRIFLRKDFGRHAYNTTFANPIGRWMTNTFVSGREERSTDMTESFRVVDHEVTYRYLQMFGAITNVNKYEPIAARVTIVTGEKTFAAVKKSVGMWQEIWPDLDLVSMPNCGHLPIREAPQQLVEAFFGNRSPVPGVSR